MAELARAQTRPFSVIEMILKRLLGLSEASTLMALMWTVSSHTKQLEPLCN